MGWIKGKVGGDAVADAWSMRRRVTSKSELVENVTCGLILPSFDLEDDIMSMDSL